MMLELLVAAMAAAGPQDAGPPPAEPTPATAPVVVPPPLNPNAPPAATIEVPTTDQQGGYWAAVWPPQAYQAHINGHVILTCRVDRYGIAEACSVASEKPLGWGFGKAALAMRPTLKVNPPTGDVGPTGVVMNIAIDFGAPNPDALGSGFAGAEQPFFSQLTLPDKPAVTVLNNPIWSSAATFDDWKRAYPASAKGGSGYAVAHCAVRAGGRLTACEIIKATPDHLGFDKAALALAGKFQVAPEWSVAPNHGQLWLDIAFRFPSSSETDDRTAANPYWIGGFDPDQELKVFPPEAAAKGVTSGRGVALCHVAEGGALTDCAPNGADPEGLGFDTAAVTLASTMRMNPWAADGSPVDGDTVSVAIRLNLQGSDAAAAAAAPPAHFSAPSGPAGATSVAAAATDVSLDGTWRGQVTEESGERGLVLHIKSRKGQFDVSLDVPERRALDLTVLKFHRDGQQVSFFLPASGATFQGELSPDGSTISGAWTGNRRSSTTDFVRDSR